MISNLWPFIFQLGDDECIICVDQLPCPPPQKKPALYKRQAENTFMVPTGGMNSNINQLLVTFNTDITKECRFIIFVRPAGKDENPDIEINDNKFIIINQTHGAEAIFRLNGCEGCYHYTDKDMVRQFPLGELLTKQVKFNDNQSIIFATKDGL